MCGSWRWHCCWCCCCYSCCLSGKRLLFRSSLPMCGDFSRGLCGCVVFDVEHKHIQRQRKEQKQKTNNNINNNHQHIFLFLAFLHFVIMFLNVCFFLLLLATAFLCFSLYWLVVDRPLPATHPNFSVCVFFSHLKYQNTHKKEQTKKKSWRRKFISFCFIFCLVLK